MEGLEEMVMRLFPAWLCVSILASITAQWIYPPKTFAQTPAIAPEGTRILRETGATAVVEHCYECHAGSEKNGGLASRLARCLAEKVATPGPAILRGNRQEPLDRSRCGTRIAICRCHQKPLSEAQVNTLVEWVKRGAVDPREGSATGPAR